MDCSSSSSSSSTCLRKRKVEDLDIFPSSSTHQVVLLNVDDYYNSLLSFIDQAVEEGFISPSARHIILSPPTTEKLVKKLEEYNPCHEGIATGLCWEVEPRACNHPCDVSR